MITVIILLALLIISSFLCIILNDYNREFLIIISSFTCMLSILGLVICGFWNYEQYSSAINYESFYNITIEQYRNSIEMYEDKAVLTLNEDTLTDLRYQGYQENIMAEIKSLKEQIISYNTALYSRKIKDKNPFLSWMIVPLSDKCKQLTLIER